MRSIPCKNHLRPGAVNDREDNVDLGESLRVAGVDELPFTTPGTVATLTSEGLGRYAPDREHSADTGWHR
jgi:hypothetical protein